MLLQAMLGAYGLVMGLTLVLMLMTLIKCAAGICITGFALNVTLVAFSLIPLITTGGLVLMRDTCGNMDSIAAKAVTLKTGNSTLGPVVSEYYLHGTASSPSTGLGDIIKGINAEYDVEGIKKSVKGTMDGLLKQVDDFTLRPQVCLVQSFVLWSVVLFLVGGPKNNQEEAATMYHTP